MAIPADAIGYRFSPSDKDLLSCLRERMNGNLLSLPADVFVDCDIYGDEDKKHWNLFDDASTSSPLSTRRIIADQESVGSPVLSLGTAGVREILSNGLGFKRYFVFKTKNLLQPRNGDNGNWIML